MGNKLGTDFEFDYTFEGLNGWNPAIGDALASISEDCLELNSNFLLNITSSIHVITWLYLPTIIVLLNNFSLSMLGLNISSYFERYQSGDLPLEKLLVIPTLYLIGILLVLLPVFYVYIRRRNTNIFFNRKTQKVHAVIGGKHYFNDWKDLQFEFGDVKVMSPRGFTYTKGFRFYLKNKNNQIKYIPVERSGPEEDATKNCLLNWDFIKSFMDQTNDRSTLTFPGTEVMYLIENSIPFYLPSETFRRWWPLPYKKTEFDFNNKALRLFNFIKRLLLFPFAIQGELLWYILMTFLPGKMKAIPFQENKSCICKKYTMADIVRKKYPSFVNPDATRTPKKNTRNPYEI